MHKSLQEFDFWHIQTADAVELIGPEKKQLLSDLKTIQNILMTLLDGSQVSDRCPLGYLSNFQMSILLIRAVRLG